VTVVATAEEAAADPAADRQAVILVDRAIAVAADTVTAATVVHAGLTVATAMIVATRAVRVRAKETTEAHVAIHASPIMWGLAAMREQREVDPRSVVRVAAEVVRAIAKE